MVPFISPVSEIQGLYQQDWCSPGRAECSIQRSFLFGSFHTEGSRESQHRPAVCVLLSTCTRASASCFCLFSFAVKASLKQTDTASDYRKKESQEKACSSCCDVSGPFGVKECFSLTDQQTGSAVWDAVGPNAHKMSLFQCCGSYLIQLIFGIV